jgi:hypothetical protein
MWITNNFFQIFWILFDFSTLKFVIDKPVRFGHLFISGQILGIKLQKKASEGSGNRDQWD